MGALDEGHFNVDLESRVNLDCIKLGFNGEPETIAIWISIILLVFDLVLWGFSGVGSRWETTCILCLEMGFNTHTKRHTARSSKLHKIDPSPIRDRESSQRSSQSDEFLQVQAVRFPLMSVRDSTEPPGAPVGMGESSTYLMSRGGQYFICF